jgi:hypothetical protein
MLWNVLIIWLLVGLSLTGVCKDFTEILIVFGLTFGIPLGLGFWFLLV